MQTQVDPQVREIHWSRNWQPTPVFLPAKFHGQRSLKSHSPGSLKESDMTKQALRKKFVDVICQVMSNSFMTPCTVAHQAPLSMEFSSKNTREGCHFLLQGIFLTQGLNPCVLHWQVNSLPLSHLETQIIRYHNSHYVFWQVKFLLSTAYHSR